MNILLLSLTGLRNEEHFQFMTGIQQLLANEDLENVQLDSLFPLFTKALKEECQVVEQVRKLAVNSTIGRHNILRTACYRSLRLAVKQYLTGELYPEKQVAARKVHALLVHYKKLSTRGATEKIASYYNFLKDVREQCSAEIALLSLDDWLCPLETANKTIEALWYQRAKIQGARRQQLRMKPARQSTDRLYRRMMEQLGVLLLLDPPAHEAVVQRLNAHAIPFKNAMTRRKSLRKANRQQIDALEDDRTCEVS